MGKDYNASEPRDYHGRWSGGGGGENRGTSAHAPHPNVEDAAQGPVHPNVSKRGLPDDASRAQADAMERAGKTPTNNIDKNLRGPGKHVGYGSGEVFHIQKSNGPKSNYYTAVGQSTGKVFSRKGLVEISRKLSQE